MDVAEWLRGLGLARYEPAFRENAIDENVLPSLTAEDLKDLGVSLVGHRRRLLDAIAALGHAVPAAAETPRVPFRDAPVSVEAERRQVTVMFCDLVDSTPLSARLDPEDYREIIAAYHHAVAKIIAEADGFVSRYMGDGVLVYFGFPQAHEDDAERAVRAGLGAMGAKHALVEIGLAISLITGPCTDTPILREWTEALCGIPAINLLRGPDPGTQSQPSGIAAARTV